MAWLTSPITKREVVTSKKYGYFEPETTTFHGTVEWKGPIPSTPSIFHGLQDGLLSDEDRKLGRRTSERLIRYFDGTINCSRIQHIILDLQGPRDTYNGAVDIVEASQLFIYMHIFDRLKTLQLSAGIPSETAMPTWFLRQDSDTKEVYCISDLGHKVSKYLQMFVWYKPHHHQILPTESFKAYFTEIQDYIQRPGRQETTALSEVEGETPVRVLDVKREIREVLELSPSSEQRGRDGEQGREGERGRDEELEQE